MVYRIYTDASFSQHLKIAAVGYLIFKEHKCLCKTIYILSEVNSSAAAERQAIFLSLQNILSLIQNDCHQLIIRTDQLNIIKKIHHFKKEPSVKPSNSIMEIINLINIIQNKKIKVGIKYVKSHADHNEVNRNYNHSYHDEIDEACKSILNEFKIKNNLK
jgi:ribonuclease HI